MIGYLIRDWRLRAAYATTIILTILLIACVLVYPDLLSPTWRIIVPAIPGIIFALLIFAMDMCGASEAPITQPNAAVAYSFPPLRDIPELRANKLAEKNRSDILTSSYVNKIRQENEEVDTYDDLELERRLQGRAGRIMELERENRALQNRLSEQ